MQCSRASIESWGWSWGGIAIDFIMRYMRWRRQRSPEPDSSRGWAWVGYAGRQSYRRYWGPGPSRHCYQVSHWLLSWPAGIAGWQARTICTRMWEHRMWPWRCCWLVGPPLSCMHRNPTDTRISLFEVPPSSPMSRPAHLPFLFIMMAYSYYYITQQY